MRWRLVIAVAAISCGPQVVRDPVRAAWLGDYVQLRAYTTSSLGAT